MCLGGRWFLEFGSMLKKIRKEKNITQVQLSSGIMERSHLSKLENNNYIPSYERVMYLLSRLNVSYEEFIYLCNDKNIPIEKNFFIELNEYYKTMDLNGFYSLNKKCATLFSVTNLIFYKHIELISRTYIKIYLNNKETNSSIIRDIEPIKQFLIKKEDWYMYELKLLNNCVFIFTLDEAIYFVERAVRSLEKYKYFEDYNSIKQSFYSHLSIKCIENKKFHEGFKYANKAIINSECYILTHENIVSKLNLEICKMGLNMKSNLFEKYITLLRELGCDKMIEKYEKIINKYLDSNGV
ncbi:hypothetical protein CKN63_03790 [Carnobacterium divergens]|nr:hypothetical protein CKN59_03750 [Carnobacterium divergens]TFI67733.1 hypothetical protein CKN76_03825 [Carnobacterium divergens]TFI82646.1 hypothetical protein CKN74_03790 [Carnobacterium divergens]TFJ08713.1 hypothetical protein CKN75_03820 [Carnobacterium divergens]TFJ13541.1 hypothetical protein CKN71_03820 [Carnobacterium divergens]